MPHRSRSRHFGHLFLVFSLSGGVSCLPSLPPKGGAIAIAVPEIKNWPLDLCWTHDGQRLVLATEVGLEIWDVGMGTGPIQISRPPVVGAVGDLAYSKSGQFIAVSHGDSISIWDNSEWRRVATIKCSMSFGGLMTFSDNDATLVVVWLRESASKPVPVGMHALITKWDVHSGELLSSVDLGPNCSCKALSPSGRYGVIRTVGEGTGIYDLSTREIALKDSHIGFIGSSIFMQDGVSLINHRAHEISILKVPSGTEVKHLSVNIGDNRGDDSLLSVSADGRLLAAGGGFPDCAHREFDQLGNRGDSANFSLRTGGVNLSVSTAFTRWTLPRNINAAGEYKGQAGGSGTQHLEAPNLLVTRREKGEGKGAITD